MEVFSMERMERDISDRDTPGTFRNSMDFTGSWDIYQKLMNITDGIRMDTPKTIPKKNGSHGFLLGI